MGNPGKYWNGQQGVGHHGCNVQSSGLICEVKYVGQVIQLCRSQYVDNAEDIFEK